MVYLRAPSYNIFSGPPCPRCPIAHQISYETMYGSAVVPYRTTIRP